MTTNQSGSEVPLQPDPEELNLEYDNVVDTTSAFNSADSARASDAGATRQKIGEFIEETGVNSKAYSHYRQMTKMKKVEQKRDYLRSMSVLVELGIQQLDGNQPDMLDQPQK